MRAADVALAAVLDALGDAPVYWGSAPRDAPLPYYAYRASDSRVGKLGGGRDVESREYEYTVVAISRDPDEAEAMREAAVDRLNYTTIAIDGWQTKPLTWVGEYHDPGELLPGGETVPYAGDRWLLQLWRPRGA